MRRLLALWVLALPAGASAQWMTLRPPSLAESFQTLDQLETLRLQRRGQGGLEQTFIVPERPGQNQVAWYGFFWEYVDVPAPGGGKGGIRLYYYRSELDQARRALPAIESAFARLVDAFHYNPTKRIPYFLYATQREFQTQNIFAVTESVQGVTSPEDLKMTVPYFGDHSRFIEVSTHEMVHQFTIQKLEDQADEDAMGSAIHLLPLWFIEGIAEYYSKGGIDVETDLYLRDLVWNPDPRRHYEIPSFADDRVRGYIPTYKVGQARIAFIAEEYGREKIQGFLESASLTGDDGRDVHGFASLARRVLNEPIEQVDARWKRWLKRRYYPAYLSAEQDLTTVRELRPLPLEPEDFTTSPDGTLVLYRGIDRDRGRVKLFLLDARDPRRAVEVAGDRRTGLESLHPLEYGVAAVTDSLLAFSAQDGFGDRLYLQPFQRRYTPGKPARIRLGHRRRLDVRPPGGTRFITIADPTFSPDASQLAFVGVAADGRQDIYVVPVGGGEARRLTEDGFAEKDLRWGADGIYFSSDATDHGRLNLFRIDPVTGARTRLTTGPSNDRHPFPQPDGSVLYASDAGGKPDLYRLADGQTRRLTDFTTGLTHPAPAPGGRGLFAGTFHGGLFRLVEVPRAALLERPPVAIPPPAGAVLAIPSADFPASPRRYRPASVRNWKPEAGFVYGGGAGNGVAGRAALLFADVLRDHVLFVDFSIYGSLDYTQGLVLLDNRARRLNWALGGFHFVQQQLDRLDVNLVYYQRDFGVVGALRYPLDLFRRVELELTVGAVQRYCLTDFSGTATLACRGIEIPGGVYADTAAWRRVNGGVNFTLSPTVRYGYDSLRYDPYTGPLSGSSLLLELGGGWLPGRSAVHGFTRMDAEHFFQLVGRANLMLRLAAATSFAPDARSGVWEKSWWLTSADNLRGFYPLDLAYLVGQHYYVANAELQFPLSALIRLLFFDYLEGVMAVDFGGVFNRFGDRRDASGQLVEPGVWSSRTLTGVLGVNVLFGPLLLRVHFGHPFDIGGLRTPALADHARWVTNVTLRYFFF